MYDTMERQPAQNTGIASGTLRMANPCVEKGFTYASARSENVAISNAIS